MLEARHNHAVASLNGYLYVAGGYTDHGEYKSVERYDPSKDEWINVADMVYPRYDFVLIEWRGYLYAVGGQTGKEKTSVECYDCVHNEWVRCNALKKK